MELVPEEELEAVVQAKPTAFADQRARKVAFIRTFWLFILPDSVVSPYFILQIHVTYDIVEWLLTRFVHASRLLGSNVKEQQNQNFRK